MLPVLLTKKEFTVLNRLWNENGPLSMYEILEKEPNLNRNTLQAVLKKLMNMGFVEVAGFGFNKSSLTRKFTCTITQEQYYSSFLTEKSIEALVHQYIEECPSPEILSQLKAAIGKREQELTKLGQSSAD